VPGSIVPRNPKGDWAPLNQGVFNDTISLPAGGNPVIFTSLAAPPFQVVLQATCTAPPLAVDVASASGADGTTAYTVLSGAGAVLISADGLLSPQAANACAIVRATFTPGGVSLLGAPRSVDFAACVDLGGIDGVTRAVDLPLGSLDADIPGLPLGDPLVGPGGSLSETCYVNAGAQTVGAYGVITSWDPTFLEVDITVGTQGVTGASDPQLAGPTAVNPAVPGELRTAHFTLGVGFTGVLDLYTAHFTVLGSGTTHLDYILDSLVSGDSPPVDIGPATPRASPEASTSPGPGLRLP
jgi:hypothetical protein